MTNASNVDCERVITTFHCIYISYNNINRNVSHIEVMRLWPKNIQYFVLTYTRVIKCEQDIIALAL